MTASDEARIQARIAKREQTRKNGEAFAAIIEPEFDRLASDNDILDDK